MPNLVVPGSFLSATEAVSNLKCGIKTLFWEKYCSLAVPLVSQNKQHARKHCSARSFLQIKKPSTTLYPLILGVTGFITAGAHHLERDTPILSRHFVTAFLQTDLFLARIIRSTTTWRGTFKIFTGIYTTRARTPQRILRLSPQFCFVFLPSGEMMELSPRL